MTNPRPSNQQPLISVTVSAVGHQNAPARVFTTAFRIGRDPHCEICLAERIVSRIHAEVVLAGNQWWIRDLHSGNGTYIDSVKIDRAPLNNETVVVLGHDGPRLHFTIRIPATSATSRPVATPPPPQSADSDLSLTHYKKHYFQDSDSRNIGHRTMMVRQAFDQIQKKQKKLYGSIIALITLLFLIAGGVAVYKHRQVAEQRHVAEEVFYSIKSLDLQFANLLATARHSKDPAIVAQLQSYRQKRQELENSYGRFIEQLDVYEKSIGPKERIILRMARTFGECELTMPKDFVAEVMRYIDQWKSTTRLPNAVERANRNGYGPKIAQTMLLYDLPPQFFYLALQESNFDINACGPKTRWGIAKGMWQFIPSTASYYGLAIGPLRNYRRPDPKDDRFNLTKSTRAAAKYIRYIYDTDAQASGLLVLASYNWGENRVIDMIKAMPENPKERNFWQFLAKYREKIPKETYDYVFLIFSAAVIGENPALFGFDFTNPLEDAGS